MNTHHNPVSTPETTAESNHETEAVDVSTVEEVSTVAETNSKPVKSRRTRRPTPPGPELMMQAMRERHKYNPKIQEDRDRFMFDLMATAGDAILKGEVFCDNRDVMIKLLAVCFLKEDFAEKH